MKPPVGGAIVPRMKANQASSASSARPLAVLAMAMTIAALFSAVLAGCGGSGTQATSETQTTETTEPAGGTEPMEGSSDGMTAAVDGAKIYADRCALCHGATGHGDGPASAGLDPKPRNHTDGAYMNNLTDEELSKVVHEGKGAMPAWKDVLSDEEIQAVIQHVRSLADPPYPG